MRESLQQYPIHMLHASTRHEIEVLYSFTHKETNKLIKKDMRICYIPSIIGSPLLILLWIIILTMMIALCFCFVQLYALHNFVLCAVNNNALNTT